MTSHAGHAIIALPCHFVRSLSIARDRGRFARLISQLLMAYNIILTKVIGCTINLIGCIINLIQVKLKLVKMMK